MPGTAEGLVLARRPERLRLASLIRRRGRNPGWSELASPCRSLQSVRPAKLQQKDIDRFSPAMDRLQLFGKVAHAVFLLPPAAAERVSESEHDDFGDGNAFDQQEGAIGAEDPQRAFDLASPVKSNGICG